MYLLMWRPSTWTTRRNFGRNASIALSICSWDSCFHSNTFFFQWFDVGYYPATVHVGLQNAPNGKIHGVKIGWVRRPLIWHQQFWHSPLQKRNRLLCCETRCSILHEKVLLTLRYLIHGRNHLAEQTISVIFTLVLNTGFNEVNRCLSKLRNSSGF